MKIENLTFLEAMFADAAPGTHTIVCSFEGDPYAGERFKWAGRPWAPGRTLERMARTGETDRETGEIRWREFPFDSGNTYVTVSSFDPDPESGKRRRRKESFSALHAVMVDDIGTKVDRARLLLQPSALIETSPANFQAYLFLRQDNDTRDRELCELLIDRMIGSGLTATGADPGMKGVTRYGRLPVGVNAKQKYVAKLGKPFAVRCEHFDPLRRYSIREIAQAWRLDLTKPAPIRPHVELTAEQIERAQQSFDALIEVFSALGMYLGKSRSGPWHDIVCPWVHEHTDRSQSGTALAEPTEANNFAGGFRCHHSHGELLHMRDVRRFMRCLREQLQVTA